MRLPRGVTGFGDGDGPAPDFADFLAACHAAARRLGGKVVRAESCAGQVTPNFHRVSLALRDTAVEVVCNSRYPLVAAVHPAEVGDAGLTFLDVPGLADALAECGFEVLPASELNAPVRDEDLSALSWAERKQAAYWGPRTLGEWVFNFWD
jgi:hypothetical protein